jgi:hypothetical protein
LILEKLLAILEDEAWHDVYQLASQIQIPPDQLIQFSRFLSEKGIVKYEDKTHKIKITPEWKNLLPIKGEEN